MVFCNMNVNNLIKLEKAWGHNPYFNRWFSAIQDKEQARSKLYVTILILIDGFLQYVLDVFFDLFDEGHNPYFNRWFSAIIAGVSLSTEYRESQSLF